MAGKPRISPVMMSNLFTMSVCATQDARQKIGDPYSIPSEDIRRLRAELIMEEALETIQALGFEASVCYMAGMPQVTMESVYRCEPKIEDIIDGCCDLNYVLTGTMVSCGVPDMPHMMEVCQANDAKFPNGVATFNKSGKFLKPPDWHPPEHNAVMEQMLENDSLAILWERAKDRY